MKKGKIWILLSALLALTMLLAACNGGTTTKTTTIVTGSVSQPTGTTSTVPTSTTVTTTEVQTTTPVTNGLTYGGTITYLMTTDPGSFDNYRFMGPGEQTQSFYLEKLLMGDWATPRDQQAFMGAYVSTQFATGDLAESWENPDPLTYIIHLRHGIHWQDKPPVNGREFVAADVIYTYGRMLGKGIAGFDKGTPYQTYPVFANLTAITSPDKYTVIFKLSAPTPTLLENLGLVDFIRMVPHEVIDTYKDMNDWHNAVGTGPFILADYVSGSQVLFRKNPNYWGYDELHPENKLPYVDNVRQSIIPDASTSLAAFRTGKIDVRSTLWMEAKSLKQTNPELIWKQNPGVGIVLSMRNDKAPFTDIRVRKAMQMAMNLPEIAQNYYGGNTMGWFAEMTGPSLTAYWTPFADFPKDVQDGFTYNVAGAKQLLADAGLASGFTTEVVTSPYMPNDLVELTQAYLKDIGITMNIKMMDLSSWSALVYGKQHQAMAVYMAGWQSAPLDTLNLYYPNHIYNNAIINDPVYTKLADQARNEADTVKRDALIKQAVYYAETQFWVVRLPVYVDYIAWQPWLTNYQGETGLGAYNNGAVWARISVDQGLKKHYTGQ